jgi:hypothetical protein
MKTNTIHPIIIVLPNEELILIIYSRNYSSLKPQEGIYVLFSCILPFNTLHKLNDLWSLTHKFSLNYFRLLRGPAKIDSIGRLAPLKAPLPTTPNRRFKTYFLCLILTESHRMARRFTREKLFVMKNVLYNRQHTIHAGFSLSTTLQSLLYWVILLFRIRYWNRYIK